MSCKPGRTRRVLYCYIIAVCVSPLSIASEKFSIPLYDQMSPPLVIQQNGNMSGVYIDLFAEVLTALGFDFEFIPTPKKRARIMFEQGASVLSCCDNPAWRQRPQEQRIQLFTESFYHTRDIFVFPKGAGFEVDDLRELSDKRVATIRGYGYRGSEWFGERIDFDSEASLLLFIALGRADLGIVNQDVAEYWRKDNPNLIALGGEHDYATLHFRIHRNRKELLEPINKAIKNMISSGRRDQIVSSYLDKVNKESRNDK